MYLFEIVPVRLAVAEQAMHHRAGERAVGAGLHHHGEIGLLHRAVHVDVDRDDLGAALLAGARRVRHHVDLGVDRIGAPDHDQIGFRHLARIGTGDPAGAGGKAGVGRVDADGGVKARVFLGVAQPMDAVALHEAHGAGVVIRPHRLRAMARFGAQELLGDEIERVVPRYRLERARALRPGPAQRLRQAVGMMDALGVARDLGADRRRRCRRCPARRARGRWCGRPAARPRARRSKGNRADRRNGRSGWVAAAGGRADLWRPPSIARTPGFVFHVAVRAIRPLVPRHATACGPARRPRSAPAAARRGHSISSPGPGWRRRTCCR